MAKQSRGQCVFCKQSYAKSGMTRHLQACAVRKETQPGGNGRSRSDRLFHLVVEGLYVPDYWLHLEAPASVTLENLDRFLRDIWLECCGHLSMFSIGEWRYTQIFEDYAFPEDRDMDVPLSQVFYPGLEMEYEYDFGSTTHLKIRVVDERTGPAANQDIQVMARNNPPKIPCDVCGKPAVELCVMCLYEGEGALCEEHTEDHKCGDEYFLPVVNSPRMGVCGYTGDVY